MNRLFLKIMGLVILLVATARAADDPRIEGVIMDSKGRPIPNASVYVYSAKPREGEATMCATCYPDCGKKARTDDQGQFKIEKLNGDLLYRLLVTAKGWRVDYITDADPLFGSVEQRLKAHRWSDAPLERKVIGKIIDPDGKSVAGAVLNIDAYRNGPYGNYGGVKGKVETFSGTDESGEFLITCTNGIGSISATVEARGFAKRKVWLEAGGAHLLRMKRGVEVTGRLLQDGNPVPGVRVSMNSQDRSVESFLQGFDATTGPDGQFKIPNVPPNTLFFLATRLKDMAKLGLALAPQTVKTGADESTVKLGDLVLKAAHSIKGKVVLSDGKPLPGNTRVSLGLDNGYDSLQAKVDEDGAFEFKGVPTESISLSVRVTGYRVSAKNPSKDWLNEGRLVGRLEGSLENFIIHLEPGARADRNEGPQDSSERQPREKLLRGAKL
jgi:hypothetical protein